MLKPGWNCLSIPHYANISFSEQPKIILTYYNNSWINTKNLTPLYGYYIYCEKETIMKVVFTKPELSTPPKRPITKGWNLVGVNPAENDIHGVSLFQFILPIKNIFIYLINMNGNCYDIYNGKNVTLKPYKAYWLYASGFGELAGRNLY